MKRISILENGIHLVLEITDAGEVKLLHFSVLPFDEADITSEEGNAAFRLVEVLASGFDRPGARFGPKYSMTNLGMRLKYRDMRD